LSIYINFMLEPFAVLVANDHIVHIILTAAVVLLAIIALFSDTRRTPVAFTIIALLPVVTLCRAQYLYLPAVGILWSVSLLIRNPGQETRTVTGDVARWILAIALIFILFFHHLDKQRPWHHSGWVAQTVGDALQVFHPVPQDGTRFILINPPQNNRLKMGVFQNGFAEAVRLWYQNPSLDGLTVPHPDTFTGIDPTRDIVIQCSGAEIREVSAVWTADPPRVRQPVTITPGILLDGNRMEADIAIPNERIAGLAIHSKLAHATDIEQGTVVARFEAECRDGHRETFELVAGVHTAEWAIDREDVIGICRHRRAPVIASSVMGHAPHRPALNHLYRAEWRLSATESIVRLNIRSLLGKDSETGNHPVLDIREIELLMDDGDDEIQTTPASDTPSFR
ncbi:hypothetical protein JXA80_06990, partial [bacterium]|nr:hypothetical protein [candidate division CSSED10-310 bacterium]